MVPAKGYHLLMLMKLVGDDLGSKRDRRLGRRVVGEALLHLLPELGEVLLSVDRYHVADAAFVLQTRD